MLQFEETSIRLPDGTEYISRKVKTDQTTVSRIGWLAKVSGTIITSVLPEAFKSICTWILGWWR